jgi:steroid delta-isomerase-like uncharacterized protein
VDPSERNVAALRSAIQEWNAGNLQGYLALYDPQAVLQGYAGVEPGQAGIQQFYQSFWTAFPGSQLVSEDVFASGEKVACRFVLSGTHMGAFQGVPPSGRDIALPGITILEFQNGRCVRRWSYTDRVGLLQQIGALPTPDVSGRRTRG